jgi:hypothetical protein
MRMISLRSAMFVLLATEPGFAQPPSPQASASLAAAELGNGEWIEFVSREDGFRATFPSQPRVQGSTYTSEYGYPLPARIYSVERGPERYSLTVADYRGLEQQGIAHAKACPAGAEPCLGGQFTDIVGAGYWKHDVRAAITHATFKLLQRDAKLTHLSWNWQELVEGHLVQLTNNADQSRTLAAVHMHDNRLYILEGTVPKGYPEPGFFQQSLRFVDKDGNGIRYVTIYSNAYHGLGEYPLPTLAGGGGGAAAGAGGGGRGGPTGTGTGR